MQSLFTFRGTTSRFVRLSSLIDSETVCHYSIMSRYRFPQPITKEAVEPAPPTSPTEPAAAPVAPGSQKKKRKVILWKLKKPPPEVGI